MARLMLHLVSEWSDSVGCDNVGGAGMTEADVLVLKKELEGKLTQRADLKKAVDALPTRGPGNAKTREKFTERLGELTHEIERLQDRISQKTNPPESGC